MKTSRSTRTCLAALLASALGSIASASAQQVIVVSSNGFAAPYKLLAPKFEAASGEHLKSLWGSSMGPSPDAIPNRLARGEDADVVIMARSELDNLAKKGLVVEGSQADLAESRIGMAVKAGAPTPDISTVDAFKQTLLHAKSIGYSSSSSGVYLANTLFPKLGLADAIAQKGVKAVTEPVGNFVARGEVEIGFQQMGELKAVPGITIVGPIPAELQKVTNFAAGIVTTSKNKAGAAALIHFLASPAACPAMVETALDPLACPNHP